MNQKPSYTFQDCQGVAAMVSTIVGHPVDCASATGSLVGIELGSVVYQIMPGSEVEFTSPVREFWWDSTYGDTQQFWESPVAAGLHYAKHYLAFVKTSRIHSAGFV